MLRFFFWSASPTLVSSERRRKHFVATPENCGGISGTDGEFHFKITLPIQSESLTLGFLLSAERCVVLRSPSTNGFWEAWGELNSAREKVADRPSWWECAMQVDDSCAYLQWKRDAFLLCVCNVWAYLAVRLLRSRAMGWVLFHIIMNHNFRVNF